MNTDTDTDRSITLSRERFRSMLAVNMAAEDLLSAISNNRTTLVAFYAERLTERVASAEALRVAEWAEARERSAATRERVARLMAERDLGVD